MISAIRCSFFRMLSASCSGGRCSKSSAALGFLRSRLQPAASKSGGRNFPGAVVFFALVPPFEAAGKFLELDRLGFSVILPAFRERLLVVPDFFGRMRSVEEQEVCRNARVWSEDAVGQADDCMEIEVFEQFLFDAGADAIAEECAVRDDDSGASTGGPCASLSRGRG